MRFVNGTSSPFETGVVLVEFWNVSFHLGRFSAKKFTRWKRTASEPGVPGTRGRRMGARMAPFFMSKSLPGEGSDLSEESERAVYARMERRREGRRRRRLRSRIGAAKGRFVLSNTQRWHSR